MNIDVTLFEDEEFPLTKEELSLIQDKDRKLEKLMSTIVEREIDATCCGRSVSMVDMSCELTKEVLILIDEYKTLACRIWAEEMEQFTKLVYGFEQNKDIVNGVVFIKDNDVIRGGVDYGYIN